MPVIDLTPATQDYLKVIWAAQEWAETPVTTSALAGRLGFSPSTVSEAMKKLAIQGLVHHARYGAITLTEAGRAAAVRMVRRHRLIETFLVDYLGYAWDEVHIEAEILEHAVSETFIGRLAEQLGHPTRDPHGDPIPSDDGVLPPLDAMRLSEVDPGASVTVARVSDSDPELLRYLSGFEITLDTHLKVIEQAKFAGTISIQISSRQITLGIPAAQAIWVVPT